MFLILQALKQACCVTYATSYLLWHIENTIFNGNWLKRLINMKWVITSPQFSLQMSVCFYCTSARRIKTTCKNPTGYVIWDFRVFELWPAIKALLKLTFKIQWHNPPKKRVSILCYVCFNNSRDSFGNKCSWEPLETLGRGNRMDFDADCQTEWYVCGLRLDSYILYLKGKKCTADVWGHGSEIAGGKLIILCKWKNKRTDVMFCGQEAKTYVLCLQVSIDQNWMFMCLYDSYYYFRPEEPLWKSVSSFAENKVPKKRATVTNM